MLTIIKNMSDKTQKNSWKQKIAIHPGESLGDLLDSLPMSQKELSERTGLATKTINEIVKGKNPITAETAIKFSDVFGNSIEFWNNLQRNYDQFLAILAKNEKLESEVNLFRKFTCYKDLKKWKFISGDTKNSQEKIQDLLEFFGVSSLSLIPDVYQVAFRKAEHDEKKLNSENLAAWLRCGEIKCRDVKTEEFSKEKLVESLAFIRSLTNIVKPEDFLSKLIERCATFGVAVVFVPYFNNTYICGATRWINKDTALIQLSLRGKRADGFWFTFFHELGHVLLHGKKDKFIDYEQQAKNLSESDLEKEVEANEFAKNILISKNDFGRLMAQKPLNPEKISKFAREIGVHPGIVAGRVAYEIRDRQNIWPDIEKLTIRYSFKEE